MKYKESKLAHKFLDGLSGLEIGGSAHNPFGLKTKNVDFTDKDDTIYKLEEIRICGKAMPVDVVASGDKLPFPDESHDFIVSSHVLEHFPDPIKALKEWYRVIKDGGYIFMIVPHKERTFDKKNDRTTLKELIARHNGSIKVENNYEKHHSVWTTKDIVELVQHLGWRIVFIQDTDDKARNGFTIVIQKGEGTDFLDISNQLKADLYEKFDCLLVCKEDMEPVLRELMKKGEKFRKEVDAIREKSEKDLFSATKLFEENIKQIKTKHAESITDLQQKHEEKLNVMKSSKFWKLRCKYMRIKRFILGRD